MTKHCWHSLDGHFQDGAGRILQSVLPVKVAKNSFMTDCNQSAVRFPKTHDQQLFTLCWCSLSRSGRECVIKTMPIKVDNTSIMYNNKRINYILPDCNDLQLLTLCRRSVDAHFAMALYTICNHSIWHSPLFPLFWQPLWRFHLISSWLLRCSLIIHGDRWH